MIRYTSLAILAAFWIAPACSQEEIADLARQWAEEEKKAELIAEQIRDAPNGDRAASLRKDLETRLRAAFELRTRLQQQQLDQAASRLSDARKRLEARRNKAAEIIQRRAANLLRDRAGGDPEVPEPKVTEESVTAESVAATTQPALDPCPETKVTDESTNFASILGAKVFAIDGDAVNEMQPQGTGKYRGGLRIVDLQKVGIAHQSGIRVNDILLGIGTYQTTSRAELNYALNAAIEAAPPSPFYVLRRGNVLRGDLDLDDVRNRHAESYEELIELVEEAKRGVEAKLRKAEEFRATLPGADDLSHDDIEDQLREAQQRLSDLDEFAPALERELIALKAKLRQLDQIEDKSPGDDREVVARRLRILLDNPPAFPGDTSSRRGLLEFARATLDQQIRTKQNELDVNQQLRQNTRKKIRSLSSLMRHSLMAIQEMTQLKNQLDGQLRKLRKENPGRPDAKR